MGGVRWWNAKHPAAYAARIAAGDSPAVGREVLSPADSGVERVLLGVRLAEGLPLADCPPPAWVAVPALVAAGLVEPGPLDQRRVVLTRRGRLLADAVVRVLLGWDDAPLAAATSPAAS